MTAGDGRPAMATGDGGRPGVTTGDGRPVLEIQGLRKHFRGSRPARSGIVRAVDGVDLTIGRGEIVGLVGESGCGKSTVGMCVLRLLDPDGGRITLDGRDITRFSRRQMRPLRHKVQMVFQDPYSSLNPRLKVADIVGGPLRTHHAVPRAKLGVTVGDLLEQVGLSPALGDRYPHELSGGQRQRVGLARSLAVRPLLLVADEPTSALDVSVQAAILNQLATLHRSLGFSCLFISHDLAVIEYMCDRIAVMHLGSIVETGTRDQIFRSPKHPYTQALLSAALGTATGPRPAQRRVVLAGELPSPLDPPGGCSFHTRCPVAERPRCEDEAPPAVTVAEGHWARCHFVGADGSAPDIMRASGHPAAPG
jgi:oligopeptide transport system ATP-binding protein